MEYLYIGKFVATHGLKGEMKIISDYPNNSSVFKIGMTIYIGENKFPFKIIRYRFHQKYDMITLESLDTIEKVLPYKGFNIYINQDDIDTNLITDVIGYDVYNNDIYIGKVIEIMKGVKYDYIVVSDKRIIIPYLDNFIMSIDDEHKVIKTNYML